METRVMNWPFLKRIDRSEPHETTENDELSEGQFRPMIGIALGGGAARGWAHIGIMRALTEGKIFPDFVTGTSIGAVVGGCYLAGKLDNLQEFALSLNKRRILGLLDFSLGSSGLVSGGKLAALLRQNLGNTHIEDLKTPFISVATELGTGHEIWLRSGSLVKAIQASYCLPGIFKPVKIGGRWLVDGALVNPIPVSVCRALGSRVVIAVNLGADVFGGSSDIIHTLPPGPANSLPEVDRKMKNTEKKSEPDKLLKWKIFGRSDDGLPSISGVMLDSFNIIQDRIGRARLAADPPDVMIGPQLGHISLLDFDRAEELIALGYETGLGALDEIKKYISRLK